MRLALASLFVASAAVSLLTAGGCSGRQSTDTAATTGDPLVVDDGDGPEPTIDEPTIDEPTIDEPTIDGPTTMPSVERVTVSIRFVETPSEAVIETLEALGVVFAELDGERIAVGTVYTATVPEGMIEALEETAEIADVEVSGQRPIVLPDAP